MEKRRMLGLMQQQPLMISSIITHAARHHGETDIVSRGSDGTLHRTTYRSIEQRARRLARALHTLGVSFGDRVGTLAWNSYRHLEAYYAISGMGAVCHTVNPRLSHDDIAYIIGHAGDRMMFVDPDLLPILQAVAPSLTRTLTDVIVIADPDDMPEAELPAGIACHCYEQIMEAADEDFAWPVFDENTASTICYTSGTTGRPKGVVYSHRSTVLHAFAANSADVFGLTALDRVLLIVPMFHANAWSLPYVAPIAGSALVLPGRQLDGESLLTLMNEERVTFAGGVPTVWFGLLQHLRDTGARLETLKRVICGGSAVPPMLLEEFEVKRGIRFDQAWGMTETSPLGVFNSPKPCHANLTGAELLKLRARQGRGVFGIEFKIVDQQGAELPWDGQQFGNVMVRGPWVASGYYGHEQAATDKDGWFPTGDVAIVHPDGFLEITDRTKDLVKSGGEWISTITLENIAVSHPDVIEAAVIAATHPKWDERPLLIVVPRDGKEVDKPALLSLYKDKVAKWWIPDDVVAVDSLPHTATGKLNKVALREQYRGYLLTHS
jgi:acyl-CoA synthetase (AMP-forming)/AMP-acid ligase II